jgi:hypothetical protein
MMETGLAYGAVQATVRQECAMDVSKAEYVPGKRQHPENPLLSRRERHLRLLPKRQISATGRENSF